MDDSNKPLTEEEIRLLQAVFGVDPDKADDDDHVSAEVIGVVDGREYPDDMEKRVVCLFLCEACYVMGRRTLYPDGLRRTFMCANSECGKGRGTAKILSWEGDTCRIEMDNKEIETYVFPDNPEDLEDH